MFLEQLKVTDDDLDFLIDHYEHTRSGRKQVESIQRKHRDVWHGRKPTSHGEIVGESHEGGLRLIATIPAEVNGFLDTWFKDEVKNKEWWDRWFLRRYPQYRVK